MLTDRLRYTIVTDQFQFYYSIGAAVWSYHKLFVGIQKKMK